MKYLLIACGGALGACARYGLAGLAQRAATPGFPWGTFAVNLLGCLLIGVIWAASESRWPLSPGARLALLVGFLGAFTTFSTYMLETGNLLREAQYARAAFNLFGQNLGGALLFFMGLLIGRQL